jgi:hypothetical protein
MERKVGIFPKLSRLEKVGQVLLPVVAKSCYEASCSRAWLWNFRCERQKDENSGGFLVPVSDQHR